MKLLYVVSQLYPGTAYTNRNKAIVKGFTENGCQCDVLSIRPIVQEEDICVNKKIIPRSKKLYTLIGTVCNLWRLKRLIKKYDVIYCATYNDSVVKVVLQQAKKYNKLTLHERTELPDILNEIEGSSKAALTSYLSEAKKFDRLLVISTAIKDYFVKLGVEADKISIFPMIVDPHRFDGLTKRNVSFRYLAYCGNMNNNKDGIAELIEAYALSNARTTHKLMLIGSKPTGAQLTVYNNLLRKYGITDEVIFRGQVSRDVMPQLLLDADLLVLCRPNNRQALGGFPTKLGEYLSTGNPVLVTRVGDIDKYIINGKNGYLAKPGDVKDFSAHINDVLANYDKAVAVGHKGKELVMDAFNYSVQTKKVLEIIETI